MIKNPHHTSLKSSPFFEISRAQFHYFGSILTFELESKEATYRFMDKLKIIKIAANIHDNKSLIVSPYDVIYAGSSKREELGISSTMLIRRDRGLGGFKR
ncbi:MAG: PLP-dependent transferase [Wolinella sp.]